MLTFFFLFISKLTPHNSTIIIPLNKTIDKKPCIDKTYQNRNILSEYKSKYRHNKMKDR